MCVCDHLQLLDDALVVRHPQWLLALARASGDPPVLGSPLHHVGVSLQGQRVHLAVQVHGDGDGPGLGWTPGGDRRKHSAVRHPTSNQESFKAAEKRQRTFQTWVF